MDLWLLLAVIVSFYFGYYVAEHWRPLWNAVYPGARARVGEVLDKYEGGVKK